MAKMKPEAVDSDMLLTMINAEVDQVRTEHFDLISQQRIDSNFSFTNDFTNATVPSTGMSKVNLYFTPSVVNTLTMYQSKIFCSNKDTVVFNPTVGDQENLFAAKQLSLAVNSVLHKKNPGFEIITEMFRSAAVNKNSVCKVTWVDKPESFEEVYENTSTEEMMIKISQLESEGWEVEVVGEETIQEAVISEDIMVSSEVKSFTLRMTRMKGQIQIDVLPPEEFIINEDTTSIHDDDLTRFVAHRREMYRGDVGKMFPDVDVSELSDYGSIDEEYEKRARHAFDGTLDSFYDDSAPNTQATSKVTLVESWIRADVNGDGYPEWRHCFSVGSMLLMDEEWFGPLPFASYTFFPVPHKFYGLSVYDRLRSYEEAATGLLRSGVDMARLRNTFRIMAKEGSIDRRNLQSGKPGVIPVSNTFSPDDVLVVPSPTGAIGESHQLIGELRQQVIADIGIDPISGQISQDIEKSGNDSAKTAMAVDNASVKIEGYSRRFAEGALRDITWLIAQLLVEHKDSPYVQMMIEGLTPGESFKAGDMGVMSMMEKTDISAKVGLGHQTDQQKIAASQQLAPVLQQLTTNFSPALYHSSAEMLRGMGYEHPESVLGPMEYYVQQDQMLKQQQMMQAQAQQQQAQSSAMQAQTQAQAVQADIQLKERQEQFRQQLEMMKAQAEILKMSAEAGLKEEQTADLLRKFELEQWKAEQEVSNPEVSFVG